MDNDCAASFEPIHAIGQSYLGTLWVATDRRGGRQGELALLRRVRLPEGTPPDARQAIARAAAAAQFLEHENILSVIHVLDAGAEIEIAYEYVEAEPLRVLQSSAAGRGVAFPVAVSLRIGIDLLMGLESLHQAYASEARLGVFGGLSPDSVLVSRKGHVKLCDALVSSRAVLLEGMGSNIEKLGYAAPEQVLSLAPLAPACDVFAVGVVLWELLTGRRLLAGTRQLLERDLPSLHDSSRGGQAVSAKLAAIVEAALAADPRQRPESARALAEQLRQCGHPVASHDQVAQFVAAPSGEPLRPGRPVALSSERRVPSVIARIATRSVLMRAAHSAEPSARPAPGRASSAAQLAPPRPVSRRPAHTQPSVAPSGQVAAAIGLKSEPPPPVAPLEHGRSPRTMLGIGLPALPAPPAASTPPPAVFALPYAPPNRRQPSAAPSATRPGSGSAAEEPPLSSSKLHAFSLPPAPLEPLEDQTFWHAIAGAAGRASPVPKLSPPSMRRKLAIALLGAALGGTVALGATLDTRPSNRAEAPRAAVEQPPAAEGLAPPVQAARPSAGATPEIAAGKPAASALGHNFYAAKLGDSQLVEAFALERRRDLPPCSERLGEAADQYTGNQPEQSRFHFNAARRALQQGQPDTAHTQLCAATAQDPKNLDVHRSMAELALDLGDPALAKEAAERGLARTPKNAELLGLLGDALAMSGDIAGSRRVWLGILGEQVSEDERRQRLAASYQNAGERALSVFNFARARSHFRRALILTEGGNEPSLGLSDALLWLDQGRAGLAWAERAARLQPESARARVLLGDAYAKIGELENARAAWQAAKGIEPENHIAARRLSRGPR